MAGKDIQAGIKLTGDATQAVAALKSVGVEAEAMKAKVSDSTSQSGSALMAMSEKFKKGAGVQIEALAGVIGKITAVIGIATTFYALGTKISEMLKTGAERAEEFSDSLTMTDPKEKLQAVNKELEKLNAEIARRAAGGIYNPFGDSTKELEKQRNLLNGQAGALARSAQGQEEIKKRQQQEETAKKKAEAEKKADEDAAKSLQERLSRAYIDSLEDRAAVFAQTDADLAKLDAEKEAAKTQRAKDQIDELIDYRLKAEERALAEIEKKEKEKNERLVKEKIDQEKKVTDFKISEDQRLRDYQARQTAGFNNNDLYGNGSAGIDQLTTAISDLQRTIRANGGM